MEEAIDHSDVVLDHVLAGSLCFLGMAICMYMKFIRRERPGFEQVRPAKELHSPPAHDYGASITMDVAQPVAAKKSTPAHYVYQHPMRRRTHSSMNGGPEPAKPTEPAPTVLAIETTIPEENKFYAKPAPFPYSGGHLEEGYAYADDRSRQYARTSKPPEARVLSPTRQPRPPFKTVDEFVKATPIVVSPTKSEIDLFASETDSLLHLESQPVQPFGATQFPPPLAPPRLPDARGPFALREQQQPAQMQMEVARQAHIPLFLHMPLHLPIVGAEGQ
ncbi:hypothetical protein ACHHYP_06030 [Achlya hypogyna]|uniref:Uncharacterized protein n=1 Tax=Achlya hypogyna TaxID=1202772 RepID=A0A1V9YVF8_ACHHY|nr:hypothetical protein ACHHYP_06030 [Achlya hypogyna]